MIVRFLGTHNEESAATRLPAVIIDGRLVIDAGSLTAALSHREQEGIAAILLSHAHYDHIRDIPAFAFANAARLTPVYGTAATLEVLTAHLLDGVIYPRFAAGDSFLGRPVLDLKPLEAFRPVEIQGYRVLPLPVVHPLETVGFAITGPDGQSILYLTDTGPGLDGLWPRLDIDPQLIIIDTTFPNRLAQSARDSGHLCPEMLAVELAGFRQVRGSLPPVLLVHLSPRHEAEITAEVGQVAAELGAGIRIVGEGEQVTA
jgi:ribonuclease BN (tRNA processing enzyme)